ncbi:MAG TPA: sigma-70 family RNA polymerase sigma factor [Puia sp.]|nr:sigma-70 family RNA polymerase sigma factor [Puia sp.]
MKPSELLRLVEDNKGILYKISASYCRNAGDREDLMQEMVYQLLRSAQRFDDNQKFSTWMYRIALNVAISFYRKANRSGVMVELDAEAQFSDDGENEVLAERIEVLSRFIRALNELDKALMILYLEERPYREIAEILGISETNVATKLNRIRGRLKNEFKMVKN